MVYVRMLMHRTGGRHDGQVWPNYLELIDVPEWEAEDLIREHQAEYPDEPLMDRGYDVLKVADVDYESHLKRTDGEEEEVDPRYVHHVEDKEDVPDFDNDFDSDEPEVKRPYANATKDAWVQYAVYIGSDQQEAKAMTKASLIEKFGS